MTTEYKKKCPGCKKEYVTGVRHQKFCTPECGKKYNDRLKKNRVWASDHKTLLKLKARSHSLALEIVKYQYFVEGKDWKCSVEGCETTSQLEVHHKDLNFLNNTPENLVLLCTKCHALQHSKIIKECKESGSFLSSRYNESFYDLVKEILKEPIVRVQRTSDGKWYAGTSDGLQIWSTLKSEAVSIKESDSLLTRFSEEEYIKV